MRFPRRSIWRSRVLAVFAGYLATGGLGFWVAGNQWGPTPLWLPAGIAFAAAFAWGPRIWPGIALGSIGVHLGLFSANSSFAAQLGTLGAVAVISLGATLQALVAARLTRRWIGSAPWGSVTAVLSFVALIMASCVIGATCGSLALTLGNFFPDTVWVDLWLIGWAGDVAGILLLVPLLLGKNQIPRGRWKWPRVVEVLVFIALLLGLSYLVFETATNPLPHVLLPLVVWAAVRFGNRGVALTAIAIAVFATAATVRGQGPFATPNLALSVFWLETFMITITLVPLVLIAAFTERESLERSLRQGGEQLLAALAASSAGTFRWDLRSGEATWDEALRGLFGLGPGEIVNSLETFLKRVHVDDREMVAELCQRCLKEGADFDAEFRILLGDGSIRWLYDRARTFRDEAGRPSYMMGACVDVTERIEAEEQLRQLNQSLEQRVAERTAQAEQRASQLRMLTAKLIEAEQRERKRISSILHDELQQLLVAAKYPLSALAEELQEGAQLSLVKQVKERIDMAIQESRSLTVELSPPLLLEAGLGAGLKWLARWMKEKHGLEIELAAQPEAEPASQELALVLFQAVRELLLNVAKHAGTSRASVELQLTAPGQLRLTVADRGRGFDLSAHAAEPPVLGGLGLSGLRDRLALLGGQFELQSAPGAGTRVELLAPARREAACEAASVIEPVCSLGPRREAEKQRVLLVDDHTIFRQGVAELLKLHEEIELVGEAREGLEAIELARKLRPDVIVMDVTLHGMNGIEATRILARELPAARIIGLSMHEASEASAAMLEAGAVDYLSKGAPVEAIVSAIRGSGHAALDFTAAAGASQEAAH